MRRASSYLLTNLILTLTILSAQNFQWNQSQSQAFYYFDSASLNGESLSSEDWILAINPNNGVISGGSQWGGPNTTVPVMGAETGINLDDDQYFDCSIAGTCDYLQEGDSPIFAIWNSSSDEIIQNDFGTYHALYSPFSNLLISAQNSINLIDDCSGDLGGWAFVDACADCIGDSTGLEENYQNTDGDTVCNDGAANGDADNCPVTDNEDQHNYDSDSDGDACDADDDNDGALDENDSSDNDVNVCSDVDEDTCDDCSDGSYGLDDDGFDYEWRNLRSALG